MNTLDIQLQVPDLWQQEALRHLRQGKDVIVSAPTGAGKTHVFELWVESGLNRQAVFTVPTRALANDKRREWLAKGWDVGIATGDVAENLDAKVVVATLETQKSRFLLRQGPPLFVIDEYQMLGDEKRGVSYELALALLPPETQLLLFSGSVANPEQVADWLRRIGRAVELVDHRERPVPQEELFLDALPHRVPDKITGFWPRLLARALMADLGPVLVFAPRRRAAEHLARILAAALPIEHPLALTGEQRRLAGGKLARMLKSRVAFHHSGLSYRQRAGLIEPLAKAGQLRIVVATTGLAAGINFSMRSVLVTDREYQVSRRHEVVRPDELLQMFGRAGRRGLDETGYVLAIPGRPRLTDARPLFLHRCRQVDWPSLIGVMRGAVERSLDPFSEATEACSRLFSREQVPLGVEHSLQSGPRPCGLMVDAERRRFVRRENVEILNSRGQWQPRPQTMEPAPLAGIRIHHGGKWKSALEMRETLDGIGEGNLCRLPAGRRKRYGRILPVAVRDRESTDAVRLLKSILRRPVVFPDGVSPSRPQSVTDFLGKTAPLLAAFLGGVMVDAVEHDGVFRLRVDFGGQTRPAWIDRHGVPLWNPPERVVTPEVCSTCDLRSHCLSETGHGITPALAWRKLGLVQADGTPTRRGVIFSFFHQGEGLAIAAALEDETYPVGELVFDLANLRAGHRFGESSLGRGSRLASVCRESFPAGEYPGYLESGLPAGYGDGAAEAIRLLENNPSGQRYSWNDEWLRQGDVERAFLEWRSLLRQVAHAPDFPWNRWQSLRTEALRMLEAAPAPIMANITVPLLEPGQTRRCNHRLRPFR